MTREEKIELLQDQIEHGRISSAELGAECEKNEIELHEEVLAPIGFTYCDRCGECDEDEVITVVYHDGLNYFETLKEKGE